MTSFLAGVIQGSSTMQNTTLPTSSNESGPNVAEQPVKARNDAQLVEAVVSHDDHSAFAELFNRHHSMVYCRCDRILHNSQDAEDACQATFIVLYRKAKLIDKQSSVRSWLYAEARYSALHVLASRTNHGVFVELTNDVPEPEHEDDLIRREERSVIEEEIARLPKIYREPLILCYLEGLTNEEAAERIGCRYGTLVSQLSRGREMLRLRLARRGLAPEVTTRKILAEPATRVAGSEITADISCQAANEGNDPLPSLSASFTLDYYREVTSMGSDVLCVRAGTILGLVGTYVYETPGFVVGPP
jgi:RNA polymerase sigma factor (sigma-70 family)